MTATSKSERIMTDQGPGPKGLRQYRVMPSARQPLLDFIIEALRLRGCRILFCSSASSAPFVLTFETPAGERVGVIAYAFLATRTPTRNRPRDERSFQLKYGSKQDANNHTLWQDPLGLFTTVLIGIHPEENYFVAADPEIHNPTKFFIRIEFKDAHADDVKSKGWHAWERSRRSDSDGPIEVLVGGNKERFLDLVMFERAAHGLSQGDRQLLAENPRRFSEYLPQEAGQSGDTATADRLRKHPLALELGLESDQILELIGSARRLKMAVRGWVAEEHLRAALERLPGVTRCERIDEEGSPDIRIQLKNRSPLTIECKNALRVLTAAGEPRIDFQRTRASKNDPCSRYYRATDFDIVAGCLHAITEKWEFKYISTGRLDPHARCEGRLASNVRIDERWTGDPLAALEAASEGS
jgi:hypothetical protein